MQIYVVLTDRWQYAPPKRDEFFAAYVFAIDDGEVTTYQLRVERWTMGHPQATMHILEYQVMREAIEAAYDARDAMRAKA